MARIRTIKPDFWTDEKVVELSPFARLLFIGLWNFADDEGRMEYSEKRIRMQIFPADPVDISELFGELRREKLVLVYTVENKEYLVLPSFSKHQKVDKRSASKLPPPPGCDNSPRIPPSPADGMEGNGREYTPSGAPSSPPEDLDKILYERGKALLGKSNGALITQLKEALGTGEALSRIEQASRKENPREWIVGCIRKAPKSPPTTYDELDETQRQHIATTCVGVPQIPRTVTRGIREGLVRDGYLVRNGGQFAKGERLAS